MLKVNNVYKKFEDTTVLSDISFSLEENSIIGLAGHSGGGKSTLLRCIQRLETVDSGTIEYSCQTAFMFQDFQLFPHMTVLQNITYAPKFHTKIVTPVCNAMQMLENLGIEHKADEYPHNLSGGEKQRVALARSLMMKPELLLCDEPTSGLDVITTYDVILLLKSIKDMGVSMIISSHDLDFLTKVADHIIILKSANMVLDIDISQLEDPIEYLKNYY